MVYLQLLREYGERYAVCRWGYCLMSNHVHLVAVPMKENALANALRRAHSDYAPVCERETPNKRPFLAKPL